MRRFDIYIILGIVAVILLFLVYQYVFMIYEVTYDVNPKMLYADNSSTVTIKTKPVNSLGWEAPFRTSPAEFIIVEGSELIEVVKEDNDEGLLIVRAKDSTGNVVIHVKSRNSLLPTPIEIPIFSNAVSN
jgi:hypothetical protein